jgi:beta-glucosidase
VRVELGPGESRQIKISLPLELLAFHGADLQLKIESGPYELMVGSSSALIHLRHVIHVTGERAIARRNCFFARTQVL